MFLKLLEFLGRKKILLDRGPSHPEYHKAKPWMNRYYLLKGGYWETTNEGKFWRSPGYIGFRSADHLHRVDLKPNTDTMTVYIPGPFGLRKNKRADYKTAFKEEKKHG